jgi:hypothetical protein
MPTDDEGTPPTPPADPTPPAGPSEDEVKGWVRDALAEVLSSGDDKKDPPLPRTDKELEAWVEEKTRAALEIIRTEEKSRGKTPPDGTPDPTPEPDEAPVTKTSWQQKLQEWIWGGVEA